MSSVVRTRFAPSPTGFIHLGNIRSALYPWAFAKAHDGVFILRIEDTDEARSTQAAVDVILESMAWLGMTPDEGPHYQMQRIDRYREAVRQMLAQGLAYPCYMTPGELDALREHQMAAKVKPRYDGTWRPEPGKVLPPVPEGVAPVIRFRNPLDGAVAWQDKVKGSVEISNTELDDLVIARPAAPGQDVGTPTYNFCVVVDDIDMDITHVIRGDDHVNNTPRQINIFKALGKTPPVYAHLPTVLNEQGEKMSKRHGAKAVTQYRDEGFLPSAMVNYLARLGWSHGDEEIFTVEQFLQWFDLDHLGKSASQFDEAKLRWVNAQHMKTALEPQREQEPSEAYQKRVCEFVELVAVQLRSRGHQPSTDEKLLDMCRAFVDRCSTTAEVADWLAMYFAPVQIDPADRDKHLTDSARELLRAFADRLDGLAAWDIGGINGALKAVLEERKAKMPHLAIPVRVAVCGRTQTPDITVVLSLFDKDTVLHRLRAF